MLFSSPSRPATSLLFVLGLSAAAIVGLAEARGQPPAPPQSSSYHVALTADGRRLVGVSDSFEVSVWDALTGAPIETRQLPGLPPPGPRRGQVLLSADGARLAARQPDALEFWDVAGVQLRVISKEPPSVHGGAFSPDGQTFVAAAETADGRPCVALYDLRDGSRRPFGALYGMLAGAFFSPDGKRLATSAGRAHALQVWDLASGKMLWGSSGPMIGEPTWSHDGRWLGFRALDEVSLRDAATGQAAPFATPPPATGGIFRFSPDDRVLAYQINGGFILWDVPAGQTLHTFLEAASPLAFAPDGRTIYTRGQIIQRWDVATGRPLFPSAPDR